MRKQIAEGNISDKTLLVNNYNKVVSKHQRVAKKFEQVMKQYGKFD
jgi:hypothetical protein